MTEHASNVNFDSSQNDLEFFINPLFAEVTCPLLGFLQLTRGKKML